MSGVPTTGTTTRRGFLKTSAVLAGGAWLGSGLGLAPAASARAEEAATPAGEQVFNGCCRPNCFNCCMLNVHVREGKLVKTSPADMPNKEFNRICLRGLSHVTNVYDPDRLQYPLRRVGERGADEWERITWDEAIAEIAEKFTAYREEFGPSSIMRVAVSGNYGALNSGFTGKLFNTLNASTMGSNLDMANAVGLNRVVGWAGLWPGNDPRDLKNAKNIFLWGNNLTDAQIHDWHFMADAIEAGANVICIDPIFTQMAAKSHKFVAIRPASDTALIMGMMYVIIEEDLIDRDFLQSYTVAPFLVREDTGLFVRASDLTGEAPAEGEADPYVVWDAEVDAAVSLADAKTPELEGEFTVAGVACHTAYTLLKNEVLHYPPSVATTLCDVPEETIAELAHLACDGPVTHRVGWGPQAYDNGVHPHHAGAALAAITGQMCAPGANYSAANWTFYTAANPAASAAPEPVTSPTIPNLVMADVMANKSYNGEPIDVKALWVHNGNPLCTFTDSNSKMRDVFAKLDFIVTVDSMMTDTARYSDLVLPCAQFFEYEDIVVQGNHFHIVHAEKAIEPPCEAKPDSDIMRMLAKALGYEDMFPETDEEWLRDYINTDASAALGIDYDKLCEQKAIRYLPDPMLMWNDHVFYTPSGRMEFYVENPTPQAYFGQELPIERERLPRFFEPAEAWPTNPLHDAYPFVLMSERPRFRVHGQWAYNQILRELDPEPTVKINPADAATFGIADGDVVECYNDRGHAVAKAVLNEAVRPGTLVYPKSWQINQHIAGGWSELSSSSFDPIAVNQSYMDVLCGIRLWEGADE